MIKVKSKKDVLPFAFSYTVQGTQPKTDRITNVGQQKKNVCLETI